MIMSKTISVSQIKEAAQEAYEQFKDNTGGKNADYIPYLANICNKQTDILKMKIKSK